MGRLLEIARAASNDAVAGPIVVARPNPIDDYRTSEGRSLKPIGAALEEPAVFTTGGGSEIPPGVQLLNWNLRLPPVAIDTCSVVIDPALFARSTLEQLRTALENPKGWVGWTIPQLIDRLAQVGVVVILEGESKGL
jgi:hypothetical protein